MKVHIIGPAGSGKTTFARSLSAAAGVPAFDLDYVVYDRETGRERPPDQVLAGANEIRYLPGWVTEGAYRERWLDPILADADAIAWLDLPFRVCAVRIVKRHILAELSRDNAHPGWRRLLRFLNYSRRVHSDSRTSTAALLAAYEGKVVRCASSREAERARSRLQGA